MKVCQMKRSKPNENVKLELHIIIFSTLPKGSMIKDNELKSPICVFFESNFFNSHN